MGSARDVDLPPTGGELFALLHLPFHGGQDGGAAGAALDAVRGGEGEEDGSGGRGSPTPADGDESKRWERECGKGSGKSLPLGCIYEIGFKPFNPQSLVERSLWWGDT